MLKKEVLPNGLRVITKEEKSRASVAIGFWFGVGGRYEDDSVKGAAHFLEHIVFKGSKQYSCEKIKQTVEGVGGMLNAFTSDEQTCFYAKVPANHIDNTFEVLADMVFFPKVPKDETEKEKTVIIEEIKMYYDLPQYHVMELLDRLMWSEHQLGKPLIGTKETVSSMTNKDLLNFHKQYYAPNNAVIAICGNISHAKVMKLVKKKLGVVKGQAEQSYQKVSVLQDKAQSSFQFREIEQMHVALGAPGYDENDKRRYILGLINVIMGANMSSRLFVEVREKRGLAYSIASSTKAMHDTGAFIVRAGVESSKVVEAVDVILEELDKITKTLVPMDEFKRAKDYLLGQLLMGLEDTMEHMLWLGEGLVSRNKVKTLKKIVKEFEEIKRSDIKRIAKEVFDRNKYNLAIIGPISDEQKTQLNKILNV